MSNYKTELVDGLSENIEEKMRRDLVAYESAHGIDINYKKLSIVVRAESDEIIGVLTAFTAFSEIYIDDFWVDSAWRRKGVGTRLIQALESHFENRGFNNINLVTSAFQAPDFYRKLGYSEEFTRKNTHNPKLSKTFFAKFFEEAVQTQGLINED